MVNQANQGSDRANQAAGRADQGPGRVRIRATGRFALGLGAVLILLLAILPLLSGPGESSPPVRAAGDLDGDGKAEEYLLRDGVLSAREGDPTAGKGFQDLWESSPDWHVDSFALGDADNDGKTELVISLWKKGSFGEIRPFWHTDTDDSYKNHLFVYRLQEDTYIPVWCSSDLDRPILSFALRDVNGDGLNELVVEEGQYCRTAGERYAPDPNGPVRTTVWQWEEWGFRLL